MKTSVNLLIKYLYQELVEICKESGVPVRHRKTIDGNGGMGCYFVNSRRIYIKKNLRYSLQGVYVLVHEMGHAIDHSKGKHKSFFNLENNVPFNKERWNIIKRAEISASRRGISILNKSGFDISSAHLTDSVLDIALNPNGKNSKELFESWKSDYFSV